MGGFIVNERPTMRLSCCLYSYKARFPLFHEVSEVIFDNRILTVISLLGFYFEITNFNTALISNSTPIPGLKL